MITHRNHLSIMAKILIDLQWSPWAADHFENKLRDESLTDINPFQGKPRLLNKPISQAELRKSLNRLKYNKAAGDDQINSELLKYAPPLLDKTMADTLNKAFETHTDLNINKGVLIAIQKPGKPKGPPGNLRPITLLNTIRKALSLITLDRIRPKVEEYLAHSQSGFRPNRSSSDVVWTHKWLAAKTNVENVCIKISGIDMSAAFEGRYAKSILNAIQRAQEVGGEEHNVGLVTQALPIVVERAREMRMLQNAACALHLSDNNKAATAAANVPGCGGLFHLAVHEEDCLDKIHPSSLRLDPEKPLSLSASDVLGLPVKNASRKSSFIEIEGHKFVVPALSTFLTSSFQYFVTLGYSHLIAEPGYNLVVIDPPWRNKSVKRKKSYHTLAENDLTSIPISHLCADDALVCVWVTNNSRLIDFVKKMLFPAWSVQYLATWIWLKVTSSGEPVCDLHSEHKKPYEQIIIGRFKRKDGPDPSCSHTETRDVSQSDKVTFGVFSSGLPSEELRTSPHSNFHTNINLNSVISNKTLSDSESCVKSDGKVSRHIECSHSGSLENSINSTPLCLKNKNLVKDSSNKDTADHHGKPSHQGVSEVPDKFVVMSLPCALHSKKPILSEVLRPFLPSRPQCLELFARNLVPGWVSWGDEPLCHQHVDYMEPSTLPT
ncbi:methyltransferase-like protein 4 [Elysia marginata]|uniref:Methyltransferase-like protein 4 n=1 Tax=Elysia marginata TaxID=1093978 RepID=A0AAV4JS99_9GAST|nr:methyltransferase-like protein 4 [Elysia marginata]